MPEPVISLQDVGIKFARNRMRHHTIRDFFLRGGTGGPALEFWPLRHVSIDIASGDAVGVVGRNGQGKSTLLKLIAGVLLPDEGGVTVRGGVAPLIEITGGFTGDLRNGEMRGEGPLNETIDRYEDDLAALESEPVVART